MVDWAVYGDWRDMRRALERAIPDFASLPEQERADAWERGNALVAHFDPLKFQCANCRRVASLWSAYRCADCHAHYCGQCIRPHFEDNRALSESLRRAAVDVALAPCGEHPKGEDAERLRAKPADAVTPKAAGALTC